MNWYYHDGKGSQGPLTQEQFDSTIKEGVIGPDTLVWNEGMPNWKPHREVAAGAGTSAEQSASIIGSANQVACKECQRMFSKDDVIQYGESWVCASCKPIFLQKIKEGKETATALDYATFLRRLGGFALDYIILTAVGAVINFVVFGTSIMAPATTTAGTVGFSIVTMLLSNVLQLSLMLLYEILFIGKLGATPGKMLVGIKVVNPDGTPVTYLRAVGRAFAKMISYMVCFIGFIIAGFDPERRSLHDRMCNTRVIKK